MDRGTFLSGLEMVNGRSTFLPFRQAIIPMGSEHMGAAGFVLELVQKTERELYDLNSNHAKFRTDIREGRNGKPLDLTIRVVNVNNGSPVPNARILLQHVFFSSNGIEVGSEGNQVSDVSGKVVFKTIFNEDDTANKLQLGIGVFLNANVSGTKDFCFQVTMPGYHTGETVATEKQELKLITNASGGYDATIIIGVNVASAAPINSSPETGGQFVMSQNYPNPVRGNTTIIFSLAEPSIVWLDIYDMAGRKISRLLCEAMFPGVHSVEWDRSVDGEKLPRGNYAYQLNVNNCKGAFKQIKVMTVF